MSFWRIALALGLVIRLNFELYPTALGASESTGSVVLEWLLAAALAIAASYVAGLRAGCEITRRARQLLDAGFGALGVALMLALVADNTAVLSAWLLAIANTLLCCGTVISLLTLKNRSRLLTPSAAAVSAAAQASQVFAEGPDAATLARQATQQAIVNLRSQTADAPQSLEHHQRLHQLLLADSQRTDELLDHAREYLALLIRARERDAAMKLLATCVARDRQFRPAADDTLPAARLARSRQQPELALLCVSGFDQQHPGHPDTAALYFLSARVLQEQGDRAGAAQLLEKIIARFAGSDDAREAQIELRRLRQQSAC